MVAARAALLDPARPKDETAEHDHRRYGLKAIGPRIVNRTPDDADANEDGTPAADPVEKTCPPGMLSIATRPLLQVAPTPLNEARPHRRKRKS